LSVYERATGEKVRLSKKGKGNSNASSAYILCFSYDFSKINVVEGKIAMPRA
jgi:hypothetical protein